MTIQELRAKLPPGLFLAGIILLLDLLLALVVPLVLSDDMDERQTRLDILRGQVAMAQKQANDGGTALAGNADQAQKLAPLLAASGPEATPDRLTLLRLLEDKRKSHDLPDLRYRLGAEAATVISGSGIEIVARPVAVESSALTAGALTAFWRDLLASAPGASRLDRAEWERTPQNIVGRLEFRSLALRRAGDGKDGR